MASRQSRSSSIPVPRSLSSASPARNIESVISIPFVAPGRPRISSTQPFPRRASVTDDHRGLGVRGSSSYSHAAHSPVRSFTASSALSSRVPHSPTYEPRIIRIDTTRSDDSVCLPSSSTSPTRTRLPSNAGARASSTQRHTSGHYPTGPPSPVSSFPRPAYLEQSALRHLLHTEVTPALAPSRRAESTDAQVASAYSPSSLMDSDEESDGSPPRELAPAPVACSSSDDPVLRLPTRWSDQARNTLLSVSNDGRDLTYHGGSATVADKDAAAARTSCPIPPACGIYYYEVEIVSKGQKGHISIGFVGPDVKVTRLPGWERNSWGYHGDDGLSFAAEKAGTPYGPKFGTKDIIGCGIDFSQHRVFYTKNGTFIGLVFENVGKDIDIYPSVGLRHGGEAIRANFGQEPFKYDIEYHVQQQRNQTWSKILSTPLNPALLQIKGIFEVKKEGVARDSVSAEDRLKGPINQLVLSYLAHHGYAKTARAFQAQYQGRAARSARTMEDHDMDMDGIPDRAESAFSGVTIEEDIERRTRIVNAVVTGDIDTAIADTRTYHPSVLEAEEGLMLFKLRCRKFVELILEASEMQKRMSGAEKADSTLEDVDADSMDIDDDAASPSPVTNGFAGGSAAIPIRRARRQSKSPGRSWGHSAAAVQYENALNQAISYGQTLQADYKGDTRPEVRAIFKRTFGIVAWVDPIAVGGEAAEVASQDSRVALANELNQAILKSQGRPTQPALETLYRHTAACVVKLGLLGVGAAAFADMPKEFLDA